MANIPRIKINDLTMALHLCSKRDDFNTMKVATT